MNVLGYLVTLSVLQKNNNLFDTIEDFSVTVDNVETLADEVTYEMSNVEDGRNKLKKIQDTGYLRDGNVGIYCSKTLRDYLFYSNVSSQEEGMILTLFYKDATTINKHTKTGKKDTDFSIFLSNKGVDFADVEDEVKIPFKDDVP